MAGRFETVARSAALAAALLFTAGSMAAPAFAQATPSDRDAERASDAASDRMTGAREPQPGETQGAAVSVDLLWPECGDVRGQSVQMVECLNLQQLEEVARLSDQGRRQ